MVSGSTFSMNPHGIKVSGNKICSMGRVNLSKTVKLFIMVSSNADQNMAEVLSLLVMTLSLDCSHMENPKEFVVINLILVECFNAFSTLSPRIEEESL